MDDPGYGSYTEYSGYEGVTYKGEVLIKNRYSGETGCPSCGFRLQNIKIDVQQEQVMSKIIQTQIDLETKKRKAAEKAGGSRSQIDD